jgi:DNA-binding HxlR family transcriptional regulator
MTVESAHLEGALADRDAWTAQRCSVDAALGVVGTRSAMLIMREAYYGAHKFDEFARRVGITDAVTATRLKHLSTAGLLRREPYREPGQRTRYEYHLTAMGRDLLPALLALMQWGDQYLSGPAGGPLAVRHSGCGAAAHVRVTCTEGHEVPLSELSISPARSRRRPRRGHDQRGPDVDR